MTHRIIATVCAGIGLIAFTGCTNITLLRIEELKQVQAHVDSLKTEILLEQAKMQKEQAELLRVIRADMQVKFGQLEQRFTAMETGISESQSKLSKIDAKTQEIRLRWEQKALDDSMTTAGRSAEVEKLFQIAYGDFTAGRYDLARGGFMDIVTRFPEDAVSEESMYWIAESHYAQKEYDSAEQEYMNYMKTYREGKKLCACLYKLGLIYEKKKKVKSQKMVWDRLVSQCPDSEEARAVTGSSR